ncbi:MAG: U32 family peptidase [Oscillospiraceae bacterium]|nr:U32 family peptidase [Oscillospiraceae bacterium]
MVIITAVSSRDAVKAAINAGADELLLTQPFCMQELCDVLPFSRSKGVKTILDLSGLCTDSEMGNRAELLGKLYALGLDGVQAKELGTLRLAEKIAPECELHWGVPCLTLEDVRFAQGQNCKRAFVSPFIDVSDFLQLCSQSSLPLYGLVLGPLCPSGEPGRCLLDKNRREYSCLRECARAFGDEKKGTQFFTRDLCLLSHRGKISGLSAALVVSPDPAPETVNFFTRITYDTMNHQPFHIQSLQKALAALGRPESSGAPFAGEGDIWLWDFEPGKKNERFWTANKLDMRTQRRRAAIPVRFFALIEDGVPARLAVDDYAGHTLYVIGAIPFPDMVGLSEEEANEELYNDSDDGYYCKEARSQIAPHVRLSVSDMVKMRQEALRKLTEMRSAPLKRQAGAAEPIAALLPCAKSPVILVKVHKLSQITSELLGCNPERIYIPMNELLSDREKSIKLISCQTVPVAILPRAARECDNPEIMRGLQELYRLGLREALVCRPGQIAVALNAGFSIRADFAVSDSRTLKEVHSLRVLSCTLAPWMTFDEISRLSHIMDTEIIGYGRLPMLASQNCLIKSKNKSCSCDNHVEILGSNGGYFPLIRDSGHGTTIYHHDKVWLAGNKNWHHIGLWGIRLDFTTESPRECVQVMQAYTRRGPYMPHSQTTGFYMPEHNGIRDKRRF